MAYRIENTCLPNNTEPLCCLLRAEKPVSDPLRKRYQEDPESISQSDTGTPQKQKNTKLVHFQIELAHELRHCSCCSMLPSLNNMQMYRGCRVEKNAKY